LNNELNITQMARSEELGTGISKVYKYSKAYSGKDEIEFLEQNIFVAKVPLDIRFLQRNKHRFQLRNLHAGYLAADKTIDEFCCKFHYR
jgi:predicted HTH transcriptional regulator